jgi:HTH-type transcriptional regulator/antitoxin HigA
MKDRRPAEAFPPGEFIRDELEARGWTQEDLAEIMGRDLRLVNEIITGKRSITPDTARSLGEALDTSAQYWMNLQTSFQLSQSESSIQDIARRSKLYEKAPVRLMVKRNWIESSLNIDVIEKRICDFFEINSLDEEPGLVHIPRKSTSYAGATTIQLAWLYRAVHLSKAIDVKRFTQPKLDKALVQLKALLPNPQDIRMIPKILLDAGIKFLVIEPLPQSKIDGVTLWLDGSPVIALSLRYDRIDYFWHTLAHELVGHVKSEDGKDADAILDIDLSGQQNDIDRPQYEINADRSAVSFLVPQVELDNFVARVGPLYSKARITGFAKNIHVHPGIVVGQLQHPSRGELNYSQHRDMLVKVRDIITSTALTDGWGHSLPANS